MKSVFFLFCPPFAAFFNTLHNVFLNGITVLYEICSSAFCLFESPKIAWMCLHRYLNTKFWLFDQIREDGKLCYTVSRFYFVSLF